MKGETLACRGLSAGYGRAPVLRGVSLAFTPGTITGLLGANGAGKSTLLRCLARLHAPARGAVTLGDRDVHRDLDERGAARRIAFVPQAEAPAWSLTVRELVELGRTPWVGRFGWLGPNDRRPVEAALRALDVAALATRSLGALSGGERKRAGIARALAQDARVLLLDEPTAHLDVHHALDLWALLRRLARAGHVVIVTSHELWQLARGCDRLVLLDRGRVAADGKPARVLASRAASRAFRVRLRIARVGGVPTPVVAPRD